MTKMMLRGVPALVLAVGGLAYGVVAVAGGTVPGLTQETIVADNAATAGDRLNPIVSGRDLVQVNGTSTDTKDPVTGKKGRQGYR